MYDIKILRANEDGSCLHNYPDFGNNDCGPIIGFSTEEKTVEPMALADLNLPISLENELWLEVRNVKPGQGSMSDDEYYKSGGYSKSCGCLYKDGICKHDD